MLVGYVVVGPASLGQRSLRWLFSVDRLGVVRARRRTLGERDAGTLIFPQLNVCWRGSNGLLKPVLAMSSGL
jgi:hypothetical protein